MSDEYVTENPEKLHHKISQKLGPQRIKTAKSPKTRIDQIKSEKYRTNSHRPMREASGARIPGANNE